MDRMILRQTSRATTPILTKKIALAHIKEFHDHYERLGAMEAQADRD
jgi:hypothetical protein